MAIAPILGEFSQENRLILRLLGMQAAAVLTAAFVFFVASRRGGIECLGVSRLRSSDLFWAGASYLAFLPVYLAVALLWTRTLHAFDYRPPAQELLQALPGLEGYELAIALFVIVAVGPWFEELLFRAFLQPALQRRLGSGLGLVLASAMFAMLHEPIAMLPVFSLGLLFGYLYRRSGRIWVPWLAHAMHNATMALLWLNLPELRKAIEGD